MTETKFTPGPWAIDTVGHSHWIGVPKQNGNGLQEALFKIESDPEYREDIKEKRLAIAQLASAAPEMFEALQLALPYIEGAYECAFPDGDHNEYVANMVHNVLAKATGQPYTPVTNQ